MEYGTYTRIKYSMACSVVMTLSEKTRRFGRTYLPLPPVSPGFWLGLIANPNKKVICSSETSCSPRILWRSNPQSGTHSHLPWSVSQIQVISLHFEGTRTQHM
jgi:hypothetical protein